jgi:hypothetical protein
LFVREWSADTPVRSWAPESLTSIGPEASRESGRDTDGVVALFGKLKSYYGLDSVPTSMEIWGCDIFAEALCR